MKKCQRCGWDREDTQWITNYSCKVGSKPKVTEVICQDCDREERLLEYRKTGHISTWLLQHATLQKAVNNDRYRLGQTLDAIIKDETEIRAQMGTFFREVWVKKGLWEKYRALPERGSKGMAGNTKVMVTDLAGRIMVQLEQEDGQYLCMISADESEPRPLGWQGIGATLTAVKAMFAEVHLAEDIQLTIDHDVQVG